MKKYIDLEMQLVVLQAQDIVTLSGFSGVDDEFENPNGTSGDEAGEF